MMSIHYKNDIMIYTVKYIIFKILKILRSMRTICELNAKKLIFKDFPNIYNLIAMYIYICNDLFITYIGVHIHTLL